MALGQMEPGVGEDAAQGVDGVEGEADGDEPLLLRPAQHDGACGHTVLVKNGPLRFAAFGIKQGSIDFGQGGGGQRCPMLGALEKGEGVMGSGELAYLLLVLGTFGAFVVALGLVSRR